MKHNRYASTAFAASMVGALLAGFAITAQANDIALPEPLALRKIMQGLEKNMQLMADGIAREDWPLVEKIAPRIADHPQPPFIEKMRIMGFVGAHIGKYKAYDGSIYEHAQAVGKAAKSNDGHGAMLMFRKLQTSCDNCHNEFQKPFVAHFYNSNDASARPTVGAKGAAP